MMFRSIDEGCTLMRGMAERLGEDVPGTRGHDPELATRDYRAAVMRCAACGSHSDCRQLQEANRVLPAAPDYCRNW